MTTINYFLSFSSSLFSMLGSACPASLLSATLPLCQRVYLCCWSSSISFLFSARSLLVWKLTLFRFFLFKFNLTSIQKFHPINIYNSKPSFLTFLFSCWQSIKICVQNKFFFTSNFFFDIIIWRNHLPSRTCNINRNISKDFYILTLTSQIIKKNIFIARCCKLY